MSKRRKKKKYPATLKLLCTVTVLLLGAADYTFGNVGSLPSVTLHLSLHRASIRTHRPICLQMQVI